MISQLAIAAPVSLSHEDKRIALGARRPWELDPMDEPPRNPDSFLRSCLMRNCDRSDFARMLSLVDSGEE
jgi:hypothetical protein